jgi:hypothetical protein
MKKLLTVTTHRARDGGWENQPTTFSYYSMGQPQTTLFPDGSNEYSTYEFGQLKTWKSRKGASCFGRGFAAWLTSADMALQANVRNKNTLGWILIVLFLTGECLARCCTLPRPQQVTI